MLVSVELSQIVSGTELHNNLKYTIILVNQILLLENVQCLKIILLYRHKWLVFYDGL